MMRVGLGAARIRECLAEYLSALKNEYSTGLILPKKGMENGSAISQTKTQTAAKSSLASATGEAGKQLGSMSIATSGGVRLEVDDLRLEENMKCTGQELFNALTQKDMIQIFTGGAAKMDDEAKAGGTFEYLGGGITGKFIEVVPFTKIVQEWRLKGWPAGHYSTVEITLKQTKEDTKLSLVQKAVPVKEMESTRQGWHRYYFEAMKRSFGFGAVLF
jgi:activator of HSP90 ATPase